MVTPDLMLTGDPKGYLLKGEVIIPRAEINLQKLPQDSAARRVAGRGGDPQWQGSRSTRRQAAALPLTALINVKLGEQDRGARASGSTRPCPGNCTVREAPGVPTSGSGQLTVAGRYKAYGQDLTIKDGRLLFAGTPLDNPRLAHRGDARDQQTTSSTGCGSAGSAQRPIITVISDPNVGEADALSYLVTGRSLSDVGSASGSSQDALASATRSLEGAGAGLVAKRIGARLGLDEAGVEENEMIGGSALTIGEYLSPRLYLSYGVGSVRARRSHRVALQAVE